MSKQAGTRPLRWLHLSDFHFRAGESWDRRSTLQALLRKVGELREEGRGPDLVFLTGDIAHSGKKAEYDQAFVFLDQLQAATGLPSTRFFLIPGNHDVDRGAVKKADDRMLRIGSQSEIEELLRDSEQMKPLGRRLEEFYAFTERFLGPARSWVPERPWRVDQPDVETDLGPIAVLQLNSAWASGSNDEKHLLVGEMQVREALQEAEGAALRIGLVHHPLSELADVDREVLETLLPSDRGVQLLLFGHLHRQRPRLSVSPSGVLAELATGATHNEDTYPRGFLYGELSAGGRLETHLFAYSKSDGGFWAPDGLAFRNAPAGIWAVDLALPKREAKTAPSEAHSATVTERYRQAVRQVHGTARFVGFADNRPRPNARVEELFVPLRLEPIGPEKEPWTTASLLKWLAGIRKAKPHPAAVVLGDPGSGKTTLSRFAAVWLAGGVPLKGGAAPRKSLLPLYLPFREYVLACSKKECSLIDFLEEQAANHLQVKLPEGFLEQAIGKGDAVLLLDGLDEVGSSGDRERMRERVLAFGEQHRKLAILVTSRVAGYDEAPLPKQGSEFFRHFRLAPFSDEDLQAFVRNWYAVQEPNDALARERGIADLGEAIVADPRVRELAGNPLLATLIALVHRFEAHLPGERAKLYELCVKTLLETWPAARNRRFEEIDEGLQRAYLEDLALRMQEARKNPALPWEAESREVVIGAEELIDLLVGILLSRNPAEEPEVVRRRIERWVQHLEQGTGLLVEQRPKVFGFFHLSFLEYLAACALERGSVPPVDQVAERIGDERWQEVCLLAVGRKATDKAFLDRLFNAPKRRESWSFLLCCLREEAAFDDGQRAEILRGVGRSLLSQKRHAWTTDQGVLDQLTRFSLRHAGWVSDWLDKEVRTAIGEKLQAVVALRGENFPLIRPLLRGRLDFSDAVADLLDYWPIRELGSWAIQKAPFGVLFLWGREGPGELAVIRAVAACALGADTLAPGLLCGLVRSGRAVREVGLAGVVHIAKKKRSGGQGLPREVRLEPEGSTLYTCPRWVAAEVASPVGRKDFFARGFAQNFSEEFNNYSRPESRYFDTGFACDFARYFDMEFNMDFARYFAQDIVLDFARIFDMHYSRNLRSGGDFALRFDQGKYSEPPVPFADEAAYRGLWLGQGSSGRLAGESWIALVSSVDAPEEDRVRYLQARTRNVEIWECFGEMDHRLPRKPSPGRLALYIALGWTQSTTTYRWPGISRWNELLGGPPPAHWLPRTQWDLCWMLHDPEDAKQRAAFDAAIEEGRHDPDFPGVADALWEDLGLVPAR